MLIYLNRLKDNTLGKYKPRNPKKEA